MQNQSEHKTVKWNIIDLLDQSNKLLFFAYIVPSYMLIKKFTPLYAFRSPLRVTGFFVFLLIRCLQPLVVFKRKDNLSAKL